MRIETTIDGKRQPPSKEIIAWNPDEKEIAHLIVDGSGFLGGGSWRQGKGEWLLDWNVATADGGYAGTSIHRAKTDDTYEWQMINVTQAGKKLPDWPLFEIQRVTKAPQGDGQQAFKSYADLVIGGTWVLETDDGKTYEHTYRWLVDGHFMINVAKGGPGVPGKTVHGVHPGTGQAADWGFSEDGSVGIGRQVLFKDGVWPIESKHLKHERVLEKVALSVLKSVDFFLVTISHFQRRDRPVNEFTEFSRTLLWALGGR